MKNPISMGILSGVIFLAGASAIVHGFYTNQFAWYSTLPAVEAQYSEPQITSIQFNAEVVKFLVLDNRLHLLMPLPITGSSSTIVDIRATMKKVRN